MYPPPLPGMKKLDLRSVWHFGSGWCTPPTQEWKSLISGQGDSFGSGWCTPPPEWKSWISGQHDILVLDDVPPPPLIEISMNAIENNWGQQVLFTNLPSPPNGIILFYSWTGSWWISISIIYGYMDSNPICHPSPAQKLKCSFLDYVQLLMISWASWWTQTPSATPLQPKKWNVHFWIMFNFWWSAEQSEQKMLTETQKNEKGPLSHQKIKCSFLDYVQLLIIGWVIQAKNIDQNAKKWKRPPKSSKNKMFIFGLHSTSDDRPSDLSKKRRPECKKQKRPPKSSKNKMFIFGLRSTSDDRPSDLSKKCWLKQKNEKGPLSHRKIKCSFFDYIQLLMIGQVIRAKNIDWNMKKQKRPPKSSKNQMFIFRLQLLMISQVIRAKSVDLNRKLVSFNFNWIWIHGLKPHLPPLSSSKTEMLVFGLCLTSDDRLG